MKNEIMVFEKEGFGRISVVIHDGSEWFVASEVASALQYSATGAMTKLVDAEDKTIRNIQNGTTYINQALINESGLYSAIFSSTLPKAKEFKRWVTSEVLPSIRKTGSYSLADRIKEKIPAMEFDTVALEMAIRILKPSENSKLIMVGKLYDKHGADKKLLPSYTENVRAIFSATKLLEDIGNPFTVRTFNKKMIEGKYLEKKTRKSSKDSSKTKEFLSLTEKGLFYGQNDVSPVNPLETQPHYYENTFKELVEALSI